MLAWGTLLSYQWRIQEFQNRGGGGGPRRGLGFVPFPLMSPSHKPYVFSDSREYYMMTNIKVYAEYTVKIDKKTNPIQIQTGGAHPARRSWIRLWLQKQMSSIMSILDNFAANVTFP